MQQSPRDRGHAILPFFPYKILTQRTVLFGEIHLRWALGVRIVLFLAQHSLTHSRSRSVSNKHILPKASLLRPSRGTCAPKHQPALLWGEQFLKIFVDKHHHHTQSSSPTVIERRNGGQTIGPRAELPKKLRGG